MRVLLGELAPRRGSPSENFGRLGELLEGRSVDLAVFPELFATGYALGDRVHRLALGPEDPARAGLGALSRSSRIAIVLGAPLVSPDRPGEVENAALAFDPDGTEGRQAKRYLPAFGPFEEGQFFSPGARSRPLLLAGHSVGLAVCYDAFFPEVFRELALAGAELLVIISASPVTSRRLFEKVLPARAVENACPVVYVNRVGVEDGLVFGGGSAAWDARGEPIALQGGPFPGAGPEEALYEAEIDLEAARRWRPFRPVLRDAAARAGPAGIRFEPPP